MLDIIFRIWGNLFPRAAYYVRPVEILGTVFYLRQPSLQHSTDFMSAISRLKDVPGTLGQLLDIISSVITHVEGYNGPVGITLREIVLNNYNADYIVAVLKPIVKFVGDEQYDDTIRFKRHIDIIASLFGIHKRDENK